LEDGLGLYVGLVLKVLMALVTGEAGVEVEMVRVSVRPTVRCGVRVWVRFTAMVRGIRPFTGT
jgi:hypothetical protein